MGLLPELFSHAVVDGDRYVDVALPVDNAFCPTGPGGGVDPTCKVGAAVHAHANRIKDEVAGIVGGLPEERTSDPGQKDKKPYDVKLGHNAIEVKSMSIGHKTSISVHPDALWRKVLHATDTGDVFHTVVVDDRPEAVHRIYYRRGCGAYTLNSMHKVADEAELRRLVRMHDEKLPVKAQGGLPPPPPLRELRRQAEAATESRRRRDSARKERQKDLLREQARVRRER